MRSTDEKQMRTRQTQSKPLTPTSRKEKDATQASSKQRKECNALHSSHFEDSIPSQEHWQCLAWLPWVSPRARPCKRFFARVSRTCRDSRKFQSTVVQPWEWTDLAKQVMKDAPGLTTAEHNKQSITAAKEKSAANVF